VAAQVSLLLNFQGDRMPIFEVNGPDGRKFRVNTPEGSSSDDAIDYVMETYYAPQKAKKPPAEPTIGGQIKEAVKGVVPGAIGLVEQAAVGASALLPDQYEAGAQEAIRGVAAAAKKPFAPEAGYEETVGRKFGEAVGSFVPFLPLGAAGALGRIGAGALASGAGAGEALTRAQQEGATEGQKSLATGLGSVVGLSELFAPFRILSRVPESEIAGIVPRLKRILMAGGEEAAQEAAAGFAQNLIARGIYKPEQELIEGLGEQAAYGGAVGGLAQGLLDLALGRRARGAATQPTPPETPPPETPPATTPAAAAPTETIERPPINEEPLKPGRQIGLFPEKLPPQAIPPESVLAQREAGFLEEGKREDKLRQLIELRDMYDRTRQEGERLEALYNAEQDPAKKQALFDQATELKPQLDSLAQQVNQAKRGLTPEEAARPTTPEGQMTLDFGEPRLITEQDFRTMGIGATNKKLREEILGKDLRNADEVSLVKRSLEAFAANPNRSPAIVQKVEAFLNDPLFKQTPTEKPSVQEPEQPVAGAAQPSVPVSDERAGVTPPGTEAPVSTGVVEPPLRTEPRDVAEGKQPPAVGQSREYIEERKRAAEERKQKIAFGKDIGAVREEELMARANPQAQKAVKEGNFSGVLDALSKSKNPVIQEVAKRARNLKTKIEIDDNAFEEAEVPNSESRQRSIDSAKVHLGALDYLRSVAPQVEQLPPGAALPFEISSKSIPAFDRGQEAGGISLQEFANMDHSFFVPLGLGSGSKLRTKEDFQRLKNAFDAKTAELGEDRLRMTSTASSKRLAVSGLYDADTDTIRTSEYSAKNEGVLAHEIVHAQVANIVANPNGTQKPIVRKLEKLYEHVKTHYDNVKKGLTNYDLQYYREPYGVASIQEFIAEGISNPKFQYELSRIKYENTSAWNKFTQYIAKLLGLKNDNALTELLTTYAELTKPDIGPRNTFEGKLFMEAEKERQKQFTPEFRKWFGNSKIVDKEGKPLVLYRGIQGDAEGALNAEPRGKYNVFASDSPDVAASYGMPDETFGTPGSILPIYVKADKLIEFPVTVDRYGSRRFDKIEFDRRARLLAPGEVLVARQVVDIGPMAREAYAVDKEKKYSYYSDVYALGRGTSVKSAIGNRGTFDTKNRNILFLKQQQPPVLTPQGQMAQAAVNAMAGITNAKPKGPQMTTLQKVGAFFQDPAYRQDQIDKFRTQVAYKGAAVESKLAMLNQYNGKIRDAVGNIRPDVFMTAAEHADTMAVAVMKDGVLKLDPKVGWVAEKGSASLQGVIDKIKDLGTKLGDQQLAFKLANDAFIARRANYFKQNPQLGISSLPDAAKIQAGMQAFKDFPELETAFKEFTQFKNNLIDAGVQAGRFSQQQAKEWKDAADYVPWNRIKDYEDKIATSPQAYFRGLTNLKQMKEIRGGTEEINDIFDNMVGLSFWLVNSAIRNHAAVQLTDTFVSNGLGAKQVRQSQPGVDPNKTIYIYRDGNPEVYEYDSIADVYAFKGVESLGGPILKSFTAFANILRRTTTATPQFALSQLFQDAYRSTVMSGVKSPFAVASKVITGAIDAYRGDATTQQLEKMGIVGAYDLMPGRAKEEVEKEFGIRQRSMLEKGLSFMESFSIASDAALRKAVFEQTLEETKSPQFPDGDVLLARYRAQEVINFKRQGANRTVGLMRQIIPFMNAYIQGMDVFYRTMTGRGVAATERSEAFKLFLSTGVKLAALSLIYTMFVGDDDEYEGLRDYEKDKNFIIPGTGIKIPVAPEVGFFFKVLPERLYNYVTSQGTDRPQDAAALRKAIGTAAFDAFSGPNLTPQAVKPALELLVNYSFFTGTPIVGRGLEKLEPAQQFTDSTSELAKMLGGLIGVSPMKLEYFVRGTTGIAGGTLIDISNMAFADRPDKRMYELPAFKTFMYDKIPGGYKEQYYDLREKVEQVVYTMNGLKAQGRAEELEAYLTDDRINLLALRQSMNRIDQQLEKLRAFRKVISNDPGLSGAEKKDQLDEIERTENELLRAYNIPALRKEVAGL
jgi:hypothetical protein